MTTSYANSGGTGDRTALITVTTDATLGSGPGTASNLVDGAKANNTNDSAWWDSGQSGRRLTFYFNGNSKIIDEAKWYQNGPAAHGTWKWQVSDDGSSWVDKSASFTLNAGGAGDVIGDLSANTTGYKYYSILQLTGVTDSGPWLYEIEFKIDQAAAGDDGSFAVVEAPDVADFAGHRDLIGSFAVTEGSDVVTITGVLAFTGALAATEAPDVLLLSQMNAVTGSFAVSEDSDVALFSDAVIGTIAITEGADEAAVLAEVRSHRQPVIVVVSG